MVDPVVQAAFKDPDVLRKPATDWPAKRRARVHCDRAELKKLAEKWDKLGACALIPVHCVPEDEAVGLFAVNKDSEYDRLIVNPTVVNSRMYGCNTYTKTLAPGHLIGLIRLHADECLAISSDDLCEFYYTFRVSPQRAARNAIGTVFLGKEFEGFSCYDPQYADQSVYICLRTLAMGDSLAVEIAQQSHFNLLRTIADSMRPDEILQYRHPIPRGPFYELLTIDDHIGLHKLSCTPRWDPAKNDRDLEVFARAELAYNTVGLVAHPGKKQRRVFSATVLGAEIDGIAGRCSAPRNRVALLMLLTSFVVIKRCATRKILQCLLGCWIHVCLFRRPTFAVLEQVFHEGVGLPIHQPFYLSAMAVNELLALLLLGPLIQADLRVSVTEDVFMMDASPFGGALCRTRVGAFAAEEMWRHTEQRGYYTALQHGAREVLHEKGLDHEETFGPPSEQTVDFAVSLSPAPLWPGVEDVTFDCIELFSGSGNWSKAHAAEGFRVHPGIERGATGVSFGDLMDPVTFRKTAALAASGKVKEWHAGPPCWSFGTLRRPRLRSKMFPAGFNPSDPVTYEQTILAMRTAFILTLALLSGSYISAEQPGASVMFELHCFQVLLSLGCWLTRFPFCSFGSGFNKPSKWLHNKPWLLPLESTCQCRYKGCHFVIEGSFTRQSIELFDQRCSPSAAEVYGRAPVPGEAVSAYSAMYPWSLVQRMARGSKLARDHGAPTTSTAQHTVEPETRRAWHEDPDWVNELCNGSKFTEMFRYRFKKSGHINTLECRVYKSWLKFCAKSHPCSRVLGILDSRVTMGAAAKGRSSSRALSRILRSSLGYVLGGCLYPGTLHCRSSWNRADGPSRDSEVPGPTREMPLWLTDLQQGQVKRFDVIIKSACWRNPLGRWVRLLLLLCGDIEENPGPAKSYIPRGELDFDVGFSPATLDRMQKCLQEFSSWLQTRAQTSLEAVLMTAEAVDAALRAYGKECFAAGKPRYWLVYAITAVQHLRPQFRNFLAGAWQVDRKWQIEEPGQCRAVLSAPLIRAIISLSLLWGWRSFAALVALGFSGMLHPNEFVNLMRSDLIFPEDTLEQRAAMYIYIKNPKTARFARRQHVKVLDDSVIWLARKVFWSLPMTSKLFNASMAVFRRQWNAVLSHIGVPHKQSVRGATPGTLRGSGATHLYLEDEDLSKICWRGRWAKMRTLEYYIQEVGAQLFLHQLGPEVKANIAFLSSHTGTVMRAVFTAPEV